MSERGRIDLAGLLLAAAAAAVFLAARRDAATRAAAAPVPAVAGVAIDAPPRAAAEPRPKAPIAGAGTPESPFAVPFERLSLPTYDAPPLRPDPRPLAAGDLPPEIAALDGKVVELTGFVLAVSADIAEVSGALLSRFPPGCCFGSIPVVDEWVDVVVAAGARGEFPRDGMVRAVGTFAAGEVLGPDGSVKSLYRLLDARAEALW